uniref:Lhr family helicase n=1 Tax=Actinomyces sp. 187325 TaxID=2927828 RepID=UPI00202ECE53
AQGPAGTTGGRRGREVWRSDRALRAAMAAGSDGATGSGGAPARMTLSIWPHIERALLEQVLAHHTTLIFVNSRGLCERLTAHLNEAYAAHLAAERAQSGPDGGQPPPSDSQAAPEPVRHRESWEMGQSARTHALPEGAPVIAKAHHGSVSKEQRRQVEAELKSGALRCVVATASLELGIDMGSIDLVLQVAPPPSVAAGLQRVGRAEHRVGGRPRGTIYPIERTQLIDAVVVAEGMRSGSIERTALVPNALDVLAQQTVAAVSTEERTADDWYATVTRAAPYTALPRAAFDSVLTLLAGGNASADLSDLSPRIVWDRETGTLTARPGAQRLAVAASGTIPDRGLFPVVLPEGEATAGRRRVGELDEEMVNESSVGDVITLGTSSWRIRQIGTDRVVVDPAPGRSARLPFWRGEGAGRPAATGAAKGAFLREAAGLLGVGGPGEAPQPALTERLGRAGLDAHAQANLVSLLREQRRATGVIPCDTALVLEQCRDESGSWRLILHSMLGRRVHEPWAMAVKERVRRTLGTDPQVVTGDDGMVLLLPDTEQPPGADLLLFDPVEIDQLVRTGVDQTAVFAARFRECAARCLLMPTARPGSRTPLWLQRLKAGQLLEASRQVSGFPVSVEAARECLQDVWDLPSLRVLMERLAHQQVRVMEAVTQVPSPFARPLLFGYTSAFLYQEDLPHTERRAQLLSLDPDVVASLVGDGGIADLLDEEVMAEVASELQHLAARRRVRADAEGVADLLRELGPLTLDELVARSRGEGGALAAVRAGLAELERSRRTFPVRLGERECWARAEDAPALHLALGAPVPDWAGTPEDDGTGAPPSERERTPLADLVLRHARTHVLVTADDVARALGLGTAVAAGALAELGGTGALMRLGSAEQGRWIAPQVLTRVRNRSLAKAREAVKPVPPSALQQLVLERAGMVGQAAAEEALAETIAALEGVWLPAGLWESVVLPARVPGYRPAMLDDLLASGDVIWVCRDQGGAAEGLGEIALVPSDSPLAPAVGASLRQGELDREEQWSLVRAGELTAGSFAPVRALLQPRPAAAPPRRVRSRRARRGLGPGRAGALGGAPLSPVEAALEAATWHRLTAPAVTAEEQALADVESLLDRYGVVSRDTALTGGVRGGIGALLPVLRRMEDTGLVLRGAFVEGLGPSQFAAREDVDRLRDLASGGPTEPVVLDLKDPACLVGDLVPWPEPALPPGLTRAGAEPARPAARQGAHVVVRGGRPVLHAAERLRTLTCYTTDGRELERALAALVEAETSAALREPRPGRRVVESLNGIPALDRAVSDLLAAAGLVRDPRGMRLHIDPYRR